MAKIDRQELFGKIADLIRVFFATPDLTVGDDTTAEAVPTWDSYNHVNLMMLIEEEIGIRFQAQDISNFKNVGELVDSVLQKLDSAG